MAVNERKAICEQEQRDIWMMSSGAKRNLAKASFDSLPAWCACRRSIGSPGRAKQILQNQILQIKGFVGGVPRNTETAAVKPRVGI